MKPFRQRGGAWWVAGGGLAHCTWPFASLTVRDHELGLIALGARRTVAKRDVQEITLRRRLLGQGVEVRTADPGHGFTFWSFAGRALVEALEARGYEVGRAAPT